MTTNSQTYQNAQPSKLNKTAISELAQQLANHTNYKIGGDLDAVVEELGGKICFLDLCGVGSASKSGSIEIDDFRDFTITLANHTGLLKDRFTVAHELGHYMLHYLYPNQVLNKKLTRVKAQRYGFGLAETEANYFAACFLMPEEEYRSSYAENAGIHSALSEIFVVSTRSSVLRAKNLSLE